jgi:glycosyltransferase involved in cell wall biosynthesis
LIERVRRAGIPAAFIVHDDWLVYGLGFDQWIRMWRGRRRLLAPLAELALRLPTSVQLTGRFVFNSRYTLEGARAAGVDVGGASVIPPGIEPSLQRPLGRKEWGWELLYLGRIDRQKGIDTAVSALAHLPEQATLAVWGTGQEQYVEEMRELAGAHGLADRVHFHGWAGPEERLAAYRATDVVVFPVRWQEPFGLVPIEAMSLGRVVVSTAQGGSAEFLSDGDNALVFEPGDAAGLAHAVQRLAEDGALRDRLLEAGRRTAGRYTLERFAQDTVREIVAAAAGRAR